MADPISILRPGYLVSLHTAIRGGIAYERTDLPAPEAPATEADVSRWETLRTIADREEWARAVEARGRASFAVRRACVISSRFGLICPTDGLAALDAGIAAAREIADAFNKSARHSRIDVFVMRGRFAESDEENTRAIADEIRALLDAMDTGIRGLDVPTVRDAAKRAREIAGALDAKSAETMGAAVAAARVAAREIVRRVEKKGEDAGAVLRDLNVGPIAAARFALLDLGDEPAEIRAERLDAGRSLDLDAIADDLAERAPGGSREGETDRQEPATARIPGVALGRFAALDLFDDPDTDTDRS